MDSQSPILFSGDSPLHVAVRQGRIEDVRNILMKQQEDVNILNSQRETPLHLACSKRASAIVQLLIAFGADPFIRDIDDKVAHSRGDFDIQVVVNNSLYGHGLWINSPTQNNGDTPLHTAVRLGVLDDSQKIEAQSIDINYANASHESPLHLACSLGHKHIVHMLISNGADMYKRDCYNNAPIHRAVSQGHVNIFDDLITDYGCDARIKGYQGRTLLHFACGIGNVTLVNTLIQKYGISPMATDAVNQTPLHVAASHGQKEVVCLLITKYNSPVHCMSNGKLSPLHLACYCGHVPVVKALMLDYKTDVNALNENRETQMMITEFDQDPHSAIDDTPLHMACLGGHEELARLLIAKYNCHVHVKNNNKDTPLHIACGFGHSLIVRMLVSEFRANLMACNHQNDTPISKAALNGQTDIIQILITEFGCNPQMKGFEGKSLLHQACNRGNTKLAMTLITDFGLDPLLVDNNGNTPLHIACWSGHEELARLLITKYNCPVDVKNKTNETPLHKACISGNLNAVKMLVSEHKANIHARDDQNSSPLHKAAQNGHTHVIQVLISEFECSPLVKGFEGRTLLHYACKGGMIELVMTLITDFNLDPLSSDDSGNTALHIACWSGHKELARLLITKYNCPVDVKNKTNETPLHKACFYGNLSVVWMLISRHKANIHARDDWNSSPIHIAALKGHTHLIQALISEYECSPLVKGFEGRTLLHYACEGGMIELVMTLITDFNLDPLSSDDSGNTPLHLACWYGHEELARLLITKYNCPVDRTNGYGYTLLHLAVMKGHIDLCILLISEFKVDCNVLVDNEDTPLNKAIKSGNTQLVHTLATVFDCKPHIKGCETKPLLHQICAGGYDTVLQELILNFNHDSTSVDEDGNTLLHTAILYRNYEIVELLINNHSSIDCRNFQGQTPLHCACIVGHTKIAKLLIKNGAQIYITDEDGDSPLKKAYVMKNVDVLATILQSLGYESTNLEPSLLFYQACEHGSVDLANLLMTEFYVDPSKSSVLDERGNTPLHIAAFFGHKEMILLLKTFGCSVNCKNVEGQTPLHLICSQKLSDPIDSLLKFFISECGADVTIKDNIGDQAIHISAQAGCTNVMTNLIVEHSCNPHSRGFNNQTLLHQALERGHTSTAKVLVEVFHLSVHSTDNDGNTPLHLSCLSGISKSVKVLLYDYHVPIFVRNKAGKTALDLASNNSIKLLFENYTRSGHKILQAEYEQLWFLSSQKYSGSHNVTRVFVLGDSGSGKSTLVESLKRKGVISSLLPISEADVPPHTAGIVPSIHQSKKTGRLLYFDFAGDKEYYSSHSAILEMVSHSSIGHSVYIIVANMTSDDHTLCSEIGYWLSFVSYQAKVLDSHDKLKIIIVLSHSDLLVSSDSTNKLDAIKHYIKNNSDQLNKRNLNIIDIISSNCRKPQSSKAVADSIVQVSKHNSHTLSTEAALLNGLLEKDFKYVITCKFQTLLKHIKATGICLPTEVYTLYPVVKELHDIGLLMMIGINEDQHENRLLLMNIPSLTNDVHQILFSKLAEQKFSSAVSSRNAKMGIFSESLISSILPDHITKECLVQLQYCQEFSHADVGLDYAVTQNAESNDLLLYFPALCILESEHANWPHDPDLNFSIGWYAKCVGRLDYFPPRYLHVLLLRLTFMFALPASTTPTSESLCLQTQDCQCTMWRSGIHWLMREGVECIVEVVNESKGVVVVVKSRKQHTYQCIHMLTQIADVVTEAKTEFCNSVSLQCFIMKSDDTSSYVNEDRLYEVNRIKCALAEVNKDETIFSINGRQTLTLESLKLLKCHTCWGFYFSMKASTILQYIKEVVEEWEALGLALQLPYHIISDVRMDERDMESKRKELIQRWMNSPEQCGPACWWLLVKALEDTTVRMKSLAARIRAELGNIIAIQEKLIEPQYSNQKPDDNFLQSFAGVVGNRWPSLASLLSFSPGDIERIKGENERVSRSKQALYMLRQWTSRESASYGQLLECLQTVPLLRS